jgi:hypothetical protein
MLFYRAALPLSLKALTFVAGIIRRHRASIGSLWRKLDPARQALLVLAYLRKGETCAGAPQGGPEREAGRARLRGPGRHPDPGRLGRRGPAVLLRQAQEAQDEPAGHRQPRWDILWVPGSVHDKRAEWIWGVLAELEAVGLVTLADKGYAGSTWAKTPYNGQNKPESQKEANRTHARLRAPGERANAQLKAWEILSKLRCCPWRAGQLAKAIHALKARAA